jgi:hypothetical protein
MKLVFSLQCAIFLMLFRNIWSFRLYFLRPIYNFIILYGTFIFTLFIIRLWFLTLRIFGFFILALWVNRFLWDTLRLCLWLNCSIRFLEWCLWMFYFADVWTENWIVCQNFRLIYWGFFGESRIFSCWDCWIANYWIKIVWFAWLYCFVERFMRILCVFDCSIRMQRLRIILWVMV